VRPAATNTSATCACRSPLSSGAPHRHSHGDAEYRCSRNTARIRSRTTTTRADLRGHLTHRRSDLPRPLNNHSSGIRALHLHRQGGGVLNQSDTPADSQPVRIRPHLTAAALHTSHSDRTAGKGSPRRRGQQRSRREPKGSHQRHAWRDARRAGRDDHTRSARRVSVSHRTTRRTTRPEARAPAIKKPVPSGDGWYRKIIGRRFHRWLPVACSSCPDSNPSARRSYSLPGLRLSHPGGRVGELAGLKVGRGELIPPVVADAVVR